VNAAIDRQRVVLDPCCNILDIIQFCEALAHRLFHVNETSTQIGRLAANVAVGGFSVKLPLKITDMRQLVNSLKVHRLCP
jgi:hypothetical protein